MLESKNQLRDRISCLEGYCSDHEKTIAELRKRVELDAMQKDEIHDLNRKIGDLNKTIDDQKAIIRKQTEADILLNALQAVGIVPPPKADPNPNYFARQKELYDQVRGLSGSGSERDNQLASIVGGLGRL